MNTNGIGALVGFATSVLSQKFTGDRDINWGLVALDTVVGGLTIQTMYMNMEKAIRKYLIQGISKVSASIFGSTFMGNIIDW